MTPSTLFVVQISILLIPGLIWAQLDARYASKTKRDQFEFLIRALIFGLVSYAVVYLVFAAFGFDFVIADVSQADKATVITGPIAEQILAATAAGFLMAILWIYAINRKILTRFLQLIRATHSYGDEDVWDFVLNSKDPWVEYVNVRDFENHIVYAGWIDVFSETGRLRELLLKDVQVYDFESKLLFESPRIYLAKKAEGIHIEFPATAVNMQPPQEQ